MRVVGVTRRAALAVVVSAVCWMLPCGCGRKAVEPPPPPPPASSPAAQQLRAGVEGANLIIIVIDAARADHFSSFGYEMETTPRLDAFFADNILFTEARAEASNTKASISSLFTSQFPDTHGAVGVGMPLSDQGATLAEVMKNEGYATVAFSANPFLAECFGFDRGFDEFDEVFRQVDLEPNEGGGVPADLMLETAIPWLRSHVEQPFFVYLHFFEPHAPYDPPAPFRFQFMRPPDWMMGLYDGNLAYVDDRVGQLLDEIDSLGLMDNSIIVFMADHGEAFGEHGHLGHTTTVYEEMIYVPLAFHLPAACEATPQRRGEGIGLTDVMPTLLDLYGIEPPAGMQGRSRLRLLAGEEESEPYFTVSRTRGLDTTGGVEQPEQVSYAIAGPQYTLILAEEGRRVELYDRAADAGQQTNIAADHPDIVDGLRQQFEAWAETQRGRPVVLPGGRVVPSGEPLMTVDDQIQRQLRALGYTK